MNHAFRAWLAGFILLTGCTLSPSTGTVEMTTLPSTPTASSNPSPDHIPPVRADTAPFQNVTSLLDGVCYAYLEQMGLGTIVWERESDLVAFFDRVNGSGLCAPLSAPRFDFSSYVVAGAISQAAGCDAAYHVETFTYAPESATQMLTLSLEVRAGCDYELIEPVLVALPRPPEGVAIYVEVRPD